MKTFVIGDIHGRIEALCQVLKASNFNKEDDKLIVLGDIVDGGANTKEVIEELLTIQNKIICIGNHDLWFMEWLHTRETKPLWYNQGGVHTYYSYGCDVKNVPESHKRMFSNAKPYYLEDGKLFLHGGFVPNQPLQPHTKGAVNDLERIVWDRTLIDYAKINVIEGYDEVYVGHTSTQFYGSDKPVRFNNLYMMDCGAGWSGRLAIMDIDSKVFWLSDQQTPNVGEEDSDSL